MLDFLDGGSVYMAVVVLVAVVTERETADLGDLRASEAPRYKTVRGIMSAQNRNDSERILYTFL